MCRSRRELSNAYLLAKIGVDTAENEPLEVWGENSIQYSLHSLLNHFVDNTGRAATEFTLVRLVCFLAVRFRKKNNRQIHSFIPRKRYLNRSYEIVKSSAPTRGLSGRELIPADEGALEREQPAKAVNKARARHYLSLEHVSAFTFEKSSQNHDITGDKLKKKLIDIEDNTILHF